jgi:hypothetical protein
MNRRLTRRTTLSILIAAACLTAFGLTPAQKVEGDRRM